MTTTRPSRDQDWTTRRGGRSALAAKACAGALAVAALLAGGVAAPAPAHAQLFQWPWSDSKPPVPREPLNRPAPVPAPVPVPVPAPPAAAPGAAPGPGAATNWTQSRPSICVQLEQRLSQETQRGNPREQLPRIENDIRQADKNLRTAQAQLERADCYEYFLFSKSLRRTRTCIDLSSGVDAAKRLLSDLEAQRQQIMGQGTRSYQDDIIRELARNNCGPGYAQEAHRRDGGSGGGSSLWTDEESGPGGGSGGFGGYGGGLPGATYRTVCVRLCDGYYFPISFSTTASYFQRDADACQSKCAAPAELYYYKNPGEAVDQMSAFKTQEPYSRLKTAFRYRKELVQGCSCKTTEFVPQTPAPGAPGAAADRRADASAPAAQPTAAQAVPARPR